ncbi:hypothetical protein EOD41_19780 [Mucilaginibacter limnophilus]|uniref:DUF479 domain-containing protein n=1 Tax=Mucilaginibacter limnophilus TaxID=1932778 RepID=A0A437MFW4_9SPHI|nr:hypothetical protein [Mucilaginibacter limnophilus]RVT96553.1 hypothetical protein EOD41_19780 [Mucilaginibacter limnophilus]
MNFLSHYYFDCHTTDCYFVLGTVLPDLLKNADKNIILHPEKLQHTDKHVNSIIEGWKKHLEVDRYFHSSGFFLHHSHQLKLALTPVIQGSPVKPFFLGHIAIELILDNLLLTTGRVSADEFYDHLVSCEKSVVQEFLTFSGLEDTQIFFRFFESFKKDRYLHTYVDTHQIAYALKRICMRVWRNPFTVQQEVDIDEVLIAYRKAVYNDFMQVFTIIETEIAGSRV